MYFSQARREDDKQHAERKKELRKQLQQLKEQIMELIEENATIPDLEKLERYEFNLDEEERQRLIALGEQSVKQVSDSHSDNSFVSWKTSRWFISQFRSLKARSSCLDFPAVLA